MDQHYERSSPSGRDQAHFEWVIAVAEGILIERYRITPDFASALLGHHAATAGLPLVDAAHWLCTTGTLPSV